MLLEWLVVPSVVLGFRQVKPILRTSTPLVPSLAQLPRLITVHVFSLCPNLLFNALLRGFAVLMLPFSLLLLDSLLVFQVLVLVVLSKLRLTNDTRLLKITVALRSFLVKELVRNRRTLHMT